MSLYRLLRSLLMICFVIFLAGCNASTPTPQPTVVNPTPQGTATQAATPTQGVTATAAAPQEKTLVICEPYEPATLYPYGGSSGSMWSILEAVYDGPIDTRNYAAQPVLLEKLPTMGDGVGLRPITVQEGDSVVDASGALVTLKAGISVLPAGCSATSCAVKWDGKTAVKMDQLAITYPLRSGVKWSDGVLLTAADSIYSYSLAADPATPVSKYALDRTFSYKAVDDTHVEWVGLPGFADQQFGAYFWMPLPKHAWGSLGAADLLKDPKATQSPLGWGPYVIQEWAAGDHITLSKNANYFRAAEGLPHFDKLVFRFTGQPGDNNLAALRSGECDVVDQNPDFFAMFPDLLDLEKDGKLKTYVTQGPEWEHIDFGIRPASYDSGKPEAGSRANLFGDVRTRQAVAQCIDRAGIIKELMYGRVQGMQTFLPDGHPALTQDLPKYDYSPEAGMKLLDAVGWKAGSNPQAARTAKGVAGVADGTLLAVKYLTTDADLRKQVADRVAVSLRGCGIGVEVQSQSAAQLFAPGPDGAVFGRKFDLAQFAWAATSRPNCLLYTSAQIPNAENHWVGANVSGYSNPQFDAECAAASYVSADKPVANPYSDVEKLFAQELPVIPLYPQLKIAIARPDLCGLEMDASARSMLWNLENFAVGADCPKK